MLLAALGLIAFVVLWEKKHGHEHGHQPRRQGRAGAPQGPWGPPAVAAPLRPMCLSNDWLLPAQQDVPSEVTARAVEILHSPAPLGSQTVEYVAGRIWRFQVEIHGANDQNPQPHRGVGVRLCQ